MRMVPMLLVSVVVSGIVAASAAFAVVTLGDSSDDSTSLGITESTPLASPDLCADAMQELAGEQARFDQQLDFWKDAPFSQLSIDSAQRKVARYC